jgi:hypothetical protein
MADDVLTALRGVTEGLLYPSETDAPIDAFVWEPGGNTEASVRRLAGEPAKQKCRHESLADFLQDLAEEEDFRRLQTTLEKTLTGIRVYRFGSTDPTYYVVGTDRGGRLAGVKTRAVET